MATVTSREGRVSRNSIIDCAAITFQKVTSREGRVSRNSPAGIHPQRPLVTSREGRVSRNVGATEPTDENSVTSREGRVSRNINFIHFQPDLVGHVPRGTCE